MFDMAITEQQITKASNLRIDTNHEELSSALHDISKLDTEVILFNKDESQTFHDCSLIMHRIYNSCINVI